MEALWNHLSEVSQGWKCLAEYPGRLEGLGEWDVNELYHSEVTPVVRIGDHYVLDPYQADGVFMIQSAVGLVEVEDGRDN